MATWPTPAPAGAPSPGQPLPGAAPGAVTAEPAGYKWHRPVSHPLPIGGVPAARLCSHLVLLLVLVVDLLRPGIVLSLGG